MCCQPDVSTSKVILGPHIAPKVTFKCKSCETSRHCFHFYVLDKLNDFQVSYLLGQWALPNFYLLVFCLKKCTLIFPGDTLEMRFQFHNHPNTDQKFRTIKCPTCHWLNSSTKLPEINSLSQNSLEYVVHIVFLSYVTLHFEYLFTNLITHVRS